jgi:two-component system OmpR family response regulator
MPACHVLIIEDDADVALVIALCVESGGHTFEVVDTCAAAHARVQQRPRPDVLVLDRILPDGDGLDVCRELLRVSAVVLPTLVLTAAVYGDWRAEAEAAGAHVVLAKPFDPDALVDAVTRLCGRPAVAT